MNQSNCLTVDEVDDVQKFQAMMEALNMVQTSKDDQEIYLKCLQQYYGLKTSYFFCLIVKITWKLKMMKELEMLQSC
jgi:hypothetical protein